MKNLENYAVRELSPVENQSTNGGIWPLVRGVAAIAFWHWDNWDDIKAGFERAQK